MNNNSLKNELLDNLNNNDKFNDTASNISKNDISNETILGYENTKINNDDSEKKIISKKIINNELKDNLKDLNDPFWIEDYKILFYKDRLTYFFPTINMSLVEKLNAIFRMSVYLSILLYLLTNNYLYLYIMIVIGLFTCFIFYNKKDSLELYFNNDGNLDDDKVQEKLLKDINNDIKPTVENPFMNINLITDDKTKEASLPSWNNDILQKDIEDKFGYNLYRDVGDLYGKSNSQREYYTMPSTTIPNNQTSFAKWCYGVGKTCKESSIYCAPEMAQVPYVDTTNPYTGSTAII